MGIMVSKDAADSELDRRITADLRERAQSSRRDDPDYIDDAAYLEQTKKTGKFGWVWVVLVLLAALSLIFIVFL